MSRKTEITSGKTSVRKEDRRVTRTRDVLGDALVELMHEKPFEEITVQHVLDRAGVSRSTFYTHYTDKNDLFMGDVENFWEMMSTVLLRYHDTSKRIAPVAELFSHLADSHDFYAALVASGKVHEVMELGVGQFSRAIESRLMEWDGQRPNGATRKAPRSYTALSHMFAGALFSLLSWWINQSMPGTPAEMDERYHQMVWQALDLPMPDEAPSGSRTKVVKLGNRSLRRAPR